jgi:VIT family
MSSADQQSPNDLMPRSRLQTVIGKYLPDLIFGANDGVITTLAVVSGVTGAALSTSVILILGFANLLADGFSMGASNVLSRRSDVETGTLPTLRDAGTHGIATFIGSFSLGSCRSSLISSPGSPASASPLPLSLRWRRCSWSEPGAPSSRRVVGLPPDSRCWCWVRWQWLMASGP